MIMVGRQQAHGIGRELVATNESSHCVVVRRFSIQHRSELVATDEWARCVMACRIGWMAIACGAGGQVTRDRRLAGAGPRRLSDRHGARFR